MRYTSDSIAEALFNARKNEVDSIQEGTDSNSEELSEGAINYKKIANDILDDWDKLFNKNGDDNMEKAVKNYVKKNRDKIDFENFDYKKFDKEAQKIVDRGEASASGGYRSGDVPWYDLDVQMGLANSKSVDGGDWKDWFDDALYESTENSEEIIDNLEEKEEVQEGLESPEATVIDENDNVVSGDCEETVIKERKIVEAELSEVDEARWVTMKNKNHALIDNEGDVVAGGDPKTRKNISKEEVKKIAHDAGSKN